MLLSFCLSLSFSVFLFPFAGPSVAAALKLRSQRELLKFFINQILYVLNFPHRNPRAAETTRKPQRHSFCRITAKHTVGPQYQLIIARNSISPSRFVNTKLNQVFNISK